MLPKVFIGLLIVLTVVGAIGVWYVRTAAPVAAGLIAKQLCSLVFVAKLEPEQARSLYFETLIGAAQRFFRHRINDYSVTVTGVGQKATAIHRSGLGCTLIHSITAHDLPLSPVITVSAPGPEAIDHQIRASNFDQTALEQALDVAFSGPPQRNTLAVVVMHKGALVAERYAPGIGSLTPLPGWSMAKSATVTLAGVMQQRGLLHVNDQQLFARWSRRDHRSSISLNHLLRMLSGIDIEENGSGLDTNSIVLFTKDDSASYAMGRGLRDAPGSQFDYSSGSTLLAARYLTEVAGGPEPMYVLIRELFDTLGMHSAVLEPDAAGTFVGSSFMNASAQDWAKLGQLYLNRGRWNDQQLFAPEWVDYVSRITAQSAVRSYGAGFTGRRPLEIYSEHQVPAPPADTIAGRGLQNQALFIVPSQDLVVVRLGATGSYWQSGEWQLLADVIAAKL